jgi:uncharacterized damage-inducible protein DinB
VKKTEGDHASAAPRAAAFRNASRRLSAAITSPPPRIVGRSRQSKNVLIQLFGHSLYHRGQIALLLRRIGAEPASTDFVFWTRQAIGR